MPFDTWWETRDRPGYFGTDRNRIQKGFDEQYGSGKWRIAWGWGKLVLLKPEALQIYEDGYYEFLKTNKGVLDWLVSVASDVYDTDPSNVDAGFSYDVQETPNNHIHDVAIRRAVLRLGRLFEGDHPVHVRPGKEGEILGPHMVPFHRQDMIYAGPIKYKGKERDFSKDPPWWIKMGVPGSIEQFYQQNKVLQTQSSSNWSSD